MQRPRRWSRTGMNFRRLTRGLISAFSLRLVKEGLFPVEYSRDLNHAERLRLIADYHGDPIELEAVAEMIAKAERFVATVGEQLVPNQKPPKKAPRKAPRSESPLIMGAVWADYRIGFAWFAVDRVPAGRQRARCR